MTTEYSFFEPAQVVPGGEVSLPIRTVGFVRPPRLLGDESLRITEDYLGIRITVPVGFVRFNFVCIKTSSITRTVPVLQ